MPSGSALGQGNNASLGERSSSWIGPRHHAASGLALRKRPFSARGSANCPSPRSRIVGRASSRGLSGNIAGPNERALSILVALRIPVGGLVDLSSAGGTDRGGAHRSSTGIVPSIIAARAQSR